MKILMAHNFYQFSGGEDVSFNAETELLRKMGHEVICYTRDNKTINSHDVFHKVQLLQEVIWSERTRSDISELIYSAQPDLVHVQNFFPLISPSIFHTCKTAGLPVVFSVRNYRLFCPNGLFSRNQQSCEDCMEKFFTYPGIIHKCYRNSRTQTAAVATMLQYHRWRKTWDTSVDVFVALSEFCKKKLIQGGINPQRIVVKPNFVADPGTDDAKGNYAIFVGRLTEEKGVKILLNVFSQLLDIPVKIVGDGPLKDQVSNFSQEYQNIQYIGQQSHDETIALIKKARFLVFPTLWYETFGRVVIEAYACGVPVIASRIGAVQELVKENMTGILFAPDQISDLQQKILHMWKNGEECQQMGRLARLEYERKYSADINYQMLLEIYRKAAVSSR
jgi:glycosyltransferase involved in cell wall biosynthesis